MYSFKDGILKNTSEIEDIFNYDEEKYEKFKKVDYYDDIIEEGEILLIPKLFWHYVRSLEESISINFWFSH
jgi:ribosomal protein L16 Arg81 hydroxylase